MNSECSNFSRCYYCFHEVTAAKLAHGTEEKLNDSFKKKGQAGSWLVVGFYVNNYC